jgi:hypothetical protein
MPRAWIAPAGWTETIAKYDKMRVTTMGMAKALFLIARVCKAWLFILFQIGSYLNTALTISSNFLDIGFFR